jgi:hypothetical protein
MNATNSNQIEQLLEDIQTIKATVQKNRPILQQVLGFRPFRWIMLLLGLSVIIFSMLILWITLHFDGFSRAPTALRWGLYLALVADAFFLQLLKQRTYLGAVKHINKNLTLGWWLKELFSHRIMHVFIPIWIMVIVLAVVFIINGAAYYIIPMLSITLGLFYNILPLIGLKHSLICGYWFWASGMAVIVIPGIPGAIALSLTVGCGCLIAGALGYGAMVNGQGESDSDRLR